MHVWKRDKQHRNTSQLSVNSFDLFLKEGVKFLFVDMYLYH